MTDAALGLGANLGDPRVALSRAIDELAAADEVRLTAVSSLWATAPVGGPEQPEFRNAVVLVRTDLTPGGLLGLCQRLESDAGRVREVRWGPRSLDVDVLDIVGVISADPDLTVPHPRAHERAFVLAPWAEVAPDWALAPAGGPPRRVAEWADLVLAETGPDAVRRQEVGSWWC